MALETATHIANLVSTNPAGGDDLSQGDDHLRMIKQVLLTDLPLDAPASTLGMNILKTATAEAVRALIGASNMGVSSNPFRNVVINGNAKYDSRYGDAGSTFGAIAFPAGGWICDRWCADGNTTSVNTSFTNGVRVIDKYGGIGSSTLRVFTALSADSTAHLINKPVTFSCNLGKEITGNVTIKVAIPAAADSFTSLTTIYTNTVSCTSTSIGTKLVGNFTLTSSTARGVFIEFSMPTLEISSQFSFKEVQLELGTFTAADVIYEVTHPSTVKAQCQYYLKTFSGYSGLTMAGAGRQTSTTSSRVTIPVQAMHKTPTAFFVGVIIADIPGANPSATITTQYNGESSIGLDVSHAANGAVGQGMVLQVPNGATNRIELRAEIFSESDG
jgi:hypothetical protein